MDITLDNAKKFCEIQGDNFKFEILFNGLQDWFSAKFKDLKDKDNKELEMAFFQHLEWLYNKQIGVKKITDIDVSVEWEGDSIPSSLLSIYSRFSTDISNITEGNKGVVTFQL